VPSRLKDDAEPAELWQHTLVAIGEHVNLAVLHPLDDIWIIRHLQNLYAVGERPSYDEVKSYLTKIWPAWPGSQRFVRDIWRTILRNPYHYFRRARKHGRTSLRFLDGLVQDRGLSPSLDARVRRVLGEAQASFDRIALSDPDLEAFLRARRDLVQAIVTMERLREVRLGNASTGNWVGVPVDEYTDPDAREWSRLRRAYAFSSTHWL
jgi:hypothetical protein